ncbi:MAG TPA: hypothetical protein VIL46_18405 [Gemmataceae bacterium]
MRATFPLYLAGLLCGLCAATSPAAERDTQASYQFDVIVWQGDPLGSKDAGTLRPLSRPRIVTQDGRTALFLLGGRESKEEIDGHQVTVRREDPFSLRVTPMSQQDGSVLLMVEMNQWETVEQSEQDEVTQMTQSKYTRTVRPGEVIKLWANKAAERKTWVEIHVKEYER